MRDLYGDKIKVGVEVDGVFLQVADSENDKGPVKAQAMLTPETARKLANALLKAAMEVAAR